MNTAALNRPDYRKIFRSWLFFAPMAFIVLWLFSLAGGPHPDSNGRIHYGYEFGLITVAIALPLVFSLFTKDEDERDAAAWSFTPAGLFALSLVYLARWDEENIMQAIIFGFMAIVFLCIDMMSFGSKKSKEKYPQRLDRVKAYALCTILIAVFTGISLSAIKYLF